ncbi:sigma-70 family RNA polymerase sigma factor [Paenibacillus sp. M1]|uniref:Sigma-70 family RNA polymerase sigma factor n=1 Tax=Paenibacillus haidiansis TaxID=1574488 RepID=A0ABU7W140_9BACL
MNIGYNPHLGYEADVMREYKKAVHSVANKFRNSLNAGVDYEDLISVGNMGLLQAFRNYDPDRFNGKVNSFLTYAFPMIKWSIQRFLREKRYSIRIPRPLQDKVTTILKQGWTEESSKVIAELSGWKLSEAEEAKRFLDGWSIASLDQTISISSNHQEEVALIELIPSNGDFSEVHVQEFLSYLSDIEKTILCMRIDGHVQSDIAARTGLSQAHISRIIGRIGDKYYQFQQGSLIKIREELIMGRPRKQEDFSTGDSGINSIEWFVDEAVPTNPTAGLNGQGIHFNRRAIHETGWKPGQCLQVGFNASENKLILRTSANGVLLRKVSGDTNGALRIVNKRLSNWLKVKGLSLKRYALQADPNGYHYIDFNA